MNLNNILQLLLLGIAIGCIIGLNKKGGIKIDAKFNMRTIGFFLTGVIFGITGLMGGEGTAILNRIMATAGIMSILYLTWDRLKAKV